MLEIIVGFATVIVYVMPIALCLWLIHRYVGLWFAKLIGAYTELFSERENKFWGMFFLLITICLIFVSIFFLYSIGSVVLHSYAE